MKSQPVPGKRLAVTGIASLLLLVGCGGGTQPAPNRTNPTPTITSISPNSSVAGGAAFTLTINGMNFVTSSVVNFGGSATATTFVNSTQLTAAIPAASIASPGTPAVIVSNPRPGGGSSNAKNFSITNVNPVPTITVLDPSCAPPGTPLQLTVVGTNFVANSVVQWNGSNLPTTSNGSFNGLAVQIPASEVAAAGTAAVTVFNPGPGGGSSNASIFTVTTGVIDPQSIAVHPAGNFAYVASMGCDAYGYVSMFTINPTTGALASVGPAVPTNDELTDSVTVDPFGKFAYVTSSGDYWDADYGSVATYAINPTTGALTATTVGITGTGTTGTPGYFNSVAVDPSGKFAYVADGGAFPVGTYGSLANVSMYSISSTTGALTSTGVIGAGEGPDSVALDPAGKFAYVANFDSNNVSMYTIDATTEALASIGTIPAGTGPMSVAVDPAGGFVYVANFGSNDVSMYTIDPTTGALVSIGSVAAGINAFSVAVDPSGKFAYVANWTGYEVVGSISMYTINATTGVLTPVGTIATELSPTSIAIHPSGKFVYVTNSSSNSVSIYSIDSATGRLTLIGTIGT